MRAAPLARLLLAGCNAAGRGAEVSPELRAQMQAFLSDGVAAEFIAFGCPTLSVVEDATGDFVDDLRARGQDPETLERALAGIDETAAADEGRAKVRALRERGDVCALAREEMRAGTGIGRQLRAVG